MREPVRVQRERDARDDREQPEARPQPEQHEQIAHHRLAVRRLRADERIDDAAEQHGLDELRDRERDVGGGEKDSERLLGAEHREYAQIGAEEGHGRRGRRACSQHSSLNTSPGNRGEINLAAG